MLPQNSFALSLITTIVCGDHIYVKKYGVIRQLPIPGPHFSVVFRRLN